MVASIENVIQQSLNSGLRMHPGTRVRVEEGRTFISRSNKDYASVDEFKLHYALYKIEMELSKHSLRAETKRIEGELKNLGIAGNKQPLMGSKGKGGYSYAQYQAYNNLAANANTMVNEAMDYFYNMYKLEQAGELHDANGMPLSADPEYSQASAIMGKSKKSYDELVRVIQLATQLDDRLSSSGARIGIDDENFSSTAYVKRRSTKYRNYKGSMWEAWDAVL